MRLEFSAGAVVYSNNGGTLKYALVVERSGHCGFPKGHIEHGESEKETALREINEETGAVATIVGDFFREVEYSIGARKKKHVSYFLAEISDSVTLVRGDDIRCVHFVPFDKALTLLSHENSKSILRDADRYIKENIL